MTAYPIAAGWEEDLIRKVGDALNHFSSLPRPSCCHTTCFDSKSIPSITISNYVERLWKYMDCSIQCFVICMSYITRIMEKDPDFSVGILNVHTLTLSSLVVAAKFHDDTFRNQAHYAQVGGVTTGALFNLEISFLKLLDWQARTTLEEISQCCDLLCGEDASDWLRMLYLENGSQLPVVASSNDDIKLSTQISSTSECARAVAGCTATVADATNQQEIPLDEVEQGRGPVYSLCSGQTGSSSTVCSLADADT
eukprot:TRINITY_DN103583_c0_g1_i1.p1 TRINITY_DN103583_c0_g1~~TRINITY_DN103583_c0_g1_i1.p1  ORF type:complete len:253 (+),score=47.11 TRINITY_DN103583_c0_g1_i1:125-883(+)